MLSVIISTRDSERALVPTLAALVPGATAGLVSDVLIADAGSKDATSEVADIAGCVFLTSAEPLGHRLRAAAQAARGRWLMFLRPGAVPDVAWVASVERFIEDVESSGGNLAAAFRQGTSGRAALFDVSGLVRLVRGPKPQQGLLIARRFYDAVGGHAAQDSAERDLIGRIGRRRIALLPSTLSHRAERKA